MADRQTGKQTDRQTDRQTGRQLELEKFQTQDRSVRCIWTYLTASSEKRKIEKKKEKKGEGR